MTEDLTATRQVQKREQYSKWINRSVGAGTAGLFLAMVVWAVTDQQPVLFAGLGLYWLGAIGMGIGYWYSPVPLRDEFEQHTEWEANKVVSVFVLAITVIGVPADAVLSATGVYTAPGAVRGVIWGYLLLVFLFGAAHWYVKQQYE